MRRAPAELARRVAALALCAALGPACGDFDPPIPDRGPQPKPDFTLPFQGPGRIATVWEWGREEPFEQRALVLNERGASRELPVDSPWWIHWVSPSELSVTSNPRGDRPRRHQALVVDLDGRVRSVLSTDPDLENLAPSPDGRLFAHTRYTEKGTGALEILKFDGTLSVVARTRTELDSLRAASWSPDGSELVAACTACRATCAR
jgi:dipeptidyl aminopeptidase/acylaminoacyl peptidase